MMILLSFWNAVYYLFLYDSFLSVRVHNKYTEPSADRRNLWGFRIKYTEQSGSLQKSGGFRIMYSEPPDARWNLIGVRVEYTKSFDGQRNFRRFRSKYRKPLVDCRTPEDFVLNIRNSRRFCIKYTELSGISHEIHGTLYDFVWNIQNHMLFTKLF